MAEARIPENVRSFINKNISSVGQLETLLLLYWNRKSSWTLQEIAEEMRSSHVAADQQLRELSSRHLVSQSGNAGQERYKYNAGSPEQELAISELAKCYWYFRVSIITLIYNKPIEVLRTFAEAFIIKKDK